MKNVRPQGKRTCVDGSLSLKLMALMGLGFGVCLFSLHAAQPGWWSTRGAINSNSRNDNAAINEGQLKKFTYEAVQELNAKLAGGAGSTLNTMTTGWSNTYQTSGLTTNDYQTIRVGQLKYVANKVYSPLISSGYMTNAPNWLHTNSAVDSNAATIGQLKQVFAFEIGVPQVPLNLMLNLGTTQATLTWVSPIISVQFFTIQESTNGGTTWTDIQTVSGISNVATISSLTPGINYSFRVKASNAAGTSTPSTSDTAPVIALSSPTGTTLVP